MTVAETCGDPIYRVPGAVGPPVLSYTTATEPGLTPGRDVEGLAAPFLTGSPHLQYP